MAGSNGRLPQVYD